MVPIASSMKLMERCAWAMLNHDVAVRICSKMDSQSRRTQHGGISKIAATHVSGRHHYGALSRLETQKMSRCCFTSLGCLMARIGLQTWKYLTASSSRSRSSDCNTPTNK